jgi:transcriptional regulator of acetoin/glycerol metabolism
MREEIVVSWFRSVRSGVRSDHLEAPYDPDVDAQGRLAWAAGPVLDALAGDLAGTSTGLVLSDARGHIVARHVSDRGLGPWLDRIQLAPGFHYGEGHVATNAIGTALAVQRPFVVQGGEHFADVLSTMACAATPITDPRTGHVLGAVDLSCRTESASPLMLPFTKRAAWEIEQRLVEKASMPERTVRAGSRSGPLGAGNRPRFGWASLTDAELIVADLVAHGMTNRQVAAQLYLSPHTIGFHLRQIFRKLEIGSRVDLTRLVVERAAHRSATS